MATPAVSLLVPVFNRADLVGACIESALAQTMPDLEVVVVDGASTDGTWDVCQQFASQDSRVRAFRESKNAGPVRGWWRCLQEAKGRFGTFVWSDDLLMPTFLSRTTPFLKDDYTAFAYTAAEVGPHPGAGKIRYAQSVTGVIPSEAFIIGALTTWDLYPVSPACGLFRLDDLRRNFVMELPIEPAVDLTMTGAGTDVLQFLLAASQRPRIAHVAEPLAFFRVHKESISVDGRGGQVLRTYALTKVWFARQHGRSDLVPTILAWHWLADMRVSRRLMSPWAAARRYDGHSSWARLIWATARVLFRRMASHLPFMSPSRGNSRDRKVA